MIYKDKILTENPEISVCVPAFNQEKYIAETLDSILQQKIDVPFEIIIADDYSSDNTKKICLEYQSRFPERIVLISNEQNQGLLKNLFDVLFTNVRARYIAVCAGDDIWISKDKLRKQYDILENNNNVSVVHTGYNFYYESTKEFRSVNKWESPLSTLSGKEAIKHVVLENFSAFPLGSSQMFRKATIDKYKEKFSFLIYDNDAPGEALIVFSFNALEGVFVFIPEIMVNYRVRDESMCHIVDRDKELVFSLNSINKLIYKGLLNIILNLKNSRMS
jgi:glycosyltransferase involved in cell wall biosynthesis